jgi:hypothetical protein
MRTNTDTTHYGNGKKATRHNLRADRRSGEEFFAAKNPLDSCRGSDCDPQSFEGSPALFPRPWSLPQPISLYHVLTRPSPTRPCAANGPATSKVCNKKNGRGSCNWGAPMDEMNPVALDRADPAYDSCGMCQSQCASQRRIFCRQLSRVPRRPVGLRGGLLRLQEHSTVLQHTFLNRAPGPLLVAPRD